MGCVGSDCVYLRHGVGVVVLVGVIVASVRLAVRPQFEYILDDERCSPRIPETVARVGDAGMREQTQSG